MQNNKIYEKIKIIVYHTCLIIFERNFMGHFWNLLVAIKPIGGQMLTHGKTHYTEYSL